MAAPNQIAGEFKNWLNERLDSLEVDREVYGAYILGVLQEEENDEEQKDALQGILSAFLEEDTLEEVCQQILKQWTACSRSAVKGTRADAEVQAIASLIEKQAQIVVKQKEVSEEAKKRKEALLAQYAHITDEEEYPFNTFYDEEEQAAVGIPSDKCILFYTITLLCNKHDHFRRRSLLWLYTVYIVCSTVVGADYWDTPQKKALQKLAQKRWKHNLCI
uniref:Coiled-coil domain-containing protein 43 n=1 Tax=Cyprinus carpio TaxID=7962 RepID=A0A8C1VRW9_CYPCA